MSLSKGMDLSKSVTILDIFVKLNQGEAVSKEDLADKYGKDERTIQRYIKEIKDYYLFCQPNKKTAIKYDPEKEGHRLINGQGEFLNCREILAVCKILFESRAFNREEINLLVDKLLNLASPRQRQEIRKMILNELYHYTPTRHEKDLIEVIWDVNQAIKEQRIISLEYKKGNGDVIKREIKPMGLMFSEYYFYMLVEMKKQLDDYKIPYRLDRIIDYQIKEEHFKVPYSDRFEEGEFRKRIQFMFPGKITKIKLKYWGASLEAVLDRLPTARVVEEKDDYYIVKAEVYSQGIKTWLLGQAQYIELLEPESLRKNIKETINKMSRIYS